MTSHKKNFWYLTPESPNDSEYGFASTQDALDAMAMARHAFRHFEDSKIKDHYTHIDYGEAEMRVLASLAPNTDELLKKYRDQILKSCGIPKEFLQEEQYFHSSAAEARMARAMADQRQAEVSQMIFDACTKKGIRYTVAPGMRYGKSAFEAARCGRRNYQILWYSDRNKPSWMFVEETDSQPYKKAIAKMNTVKIDGVLHELKPFEWNSWKYQRPTPTVVIFSGDEVTNLTNFPNAYDNNKKMAGVVKGEVRYWRTSGEMAPISLQDLDKPYSSLFFAVKAPEPKRRLITVAEILEQTTELYVKTPKGVIVTINSRDPNTDQLFNNGGWHPLEWFHDEGFKWSDGTIGEWHSFEVIEHPDGRVEAAE